MQFDRQILSASFLTDVMWPLLERHYKEISAFQDIPLKPNFEKYLLMEKAGCLRCFTARHNGELVGYQVFFVNFNLHYSTSYQAVQDVLFIEKTKRGMGMGEAFMDWCDHELAKIGVELVYQHEKLAHPFGKLLKNLGYKQVENIHVRDLRNLGSL